MGCTFDDHTKIHSKMITLENIGIICEKALDLKSNLKDNRSLQMIILSNFIEQKHQKALIA